MKRRKVPKPSKSSRSMLARGEVLPARRLPGSPSRRATRRGAGTRRRASARVCGQARRSAPTRTWTRERACSHRGTRGRRRARRTATHATSSSSASSARISPRRSPLLGRGPRVLAGGRLPVCAGGPLPARPERRAGSRRPSSGRSDTRRPSREPCTAPGGPAHERRSSRTFGQEARWRRGGLSMKPFTATSTSPARPAAARAPARARPWARQAQRGPVRQVSDA